MSEANHIFLINPEHEEWVKSQILSFKNLNDINTQSIKDLLFKKSFKVKKNKEEYVIPDDGSHDFGGMNYQVRCEKMLILINYLFVSFKLIEFIRASDKHSADRLEEIVMNFKQSVIHFLEDKEDTDYFRILRNKYDKGLSEYFKQLAKL